MTLNAICLRTIARLGTHTFGKRPSLHQRLPFSRSLSHSINNRSTAPKSKSSKPSTDDDAVSPFNIWAQIRDSRPAVRYTVYTGLALMAAAETTFWTEVIYAKYFAGEEDKGRSEMLLARLDQAIKGYRARWMINYGTYWSANLWGL